MLEIRPGGKLIRLEGVEEKDVSLEAPLLMWEQCVLAENVRLHDIFTLLDLHLNLFDSILRNWCKELVIEGLGSTPEKCPPVPDVPEKDRIEYLELYWDIQYAKMEGEFDFTGLIFPAFHAQGPVLTEDVDGPHGWNKGERINWSLAFLSCDKLACYPVKLRNQFHVHYHNYDKKPTPEDKNFTMARFEAAQYSLGHILYGIIWELSFHGSPKDREEHSKKLREQIDKADLG